VVGAVAWAVLVIGGVGGSGCGGGEAGNDGGVPPPFRQPDFCPVDDAVVDETLSTLSLERKAAQVLMVEMGGTAAALAEGTRRNLTELGVGGAFLRPIAAVKVDPGETAALVGALQQAALAAHGIPLFVSLDQEGGHAAALNSLSGGTDTPGSMALGQARDPRLTFDCFDVMGQELQALGFNMDFAPVLDVLPNHLNGAMNTRGFGADAELVVALTEPAVWGLQNHRVLGTVKHAPGIGPTGLDTHQDLPVVDIDEAEFTATVLRPFQEAIDQGADGMMTGHIVYPAIDPDYAASMSTVVLRDLVRGRLGYQGLIVTDSIGMAGARLGAGGEVPAVRALVAGNDMVLLVDSTFEEASVQVAAIVAAVGDGRLAEADLDAAVRRVLTLKMKYCAFAQALPDLALVPERLGTDASLARTQNAADHSIVLLREEPGVLPLAPATRILFIGPGRLYEDPGSGWANAVDRSMGDVLEARAPATVRFEIPLPPSADDVPRYLALVDAADVVVVATMNAHYSAEQRDFFTPLFPAAKPVVLLTLGVPYDAWDLAAAGTVLNVTGQRSVSLEAAAKVLFGEIPASGQPAVSMTPP
jgi:beta-N-acetylhexosaminidase